ncbi:uncharacterized protein AMSG_01721 [Thecamonas trahens ATCC 50062]|uniref:DUF202 domain-containing protein n=1 Tax=Thecamonas trahens ATCC 50062 TaxID=461836 RepID=A0A0L0DT71_THETB|nr:hypothetical protein AMSG_01721 [Thecamonas trahens ATCC 50062]KNC55460.1 hypothetical protein AMSG_01721 [Thecamonas trahens ATCC 50062]|eukprot:XP_013761242.1 hypothetical protein AMSG_01721 [Thecamonas trahens ATCC 50062]
MSSDGSAQPLLDLAGFPSPHGAGAERGDAPLPLNPPTPGKKAKKGKGKGGKGTGKGGKGKAGKSKVDAETRLGSAAPSPGANTDDADDDVDDGGKGGGGGGKKKKKIKKLKRQVEMLEASALALVLELDKSAQLEALEEGVRVKMEALRFAVTGDSNPVAGHELLGDVANASGGVGTGASINGDDGGSLLEGMAPELDALAQLEAAKQAAKDQKKREKMIQKEELKVLARMKEPRTLLANERTFLSWAASSLRLGAIGTALITFFGHTAFAMFLGCALWTIAVVYLAYSIRRYRQRAQALLTASDGPFLDVAGPVSFVGIIIVAIVLYISFFVIAGPQPKVHFQSAKSS